MPFTWGYFPTTVTKWNRCDRDIWPTEQETFIPWPFAENGWTLAGRAGLGGQALALSAADSRVLGLLVNAQQSLWRPQKLSSVGLTSEWE